MSIMKQAIQAKMTAYAKNSEAKEKAKARAASLRIEIDAASQNARHAENDHREGDYGRKSA